MEREAKGRSGDVVARLTNLLQEIEEDADTRREAVARQQLGRRDCQFPDEEPDAVLAETP